MNLPTGDILQDLVATLRSTGAFAAVCLGESHQESAVPRACVVYEGQEWLPCDDEPAARWLRVRVRVTVHTRDENSGAATLRGAELCGAAAEALLVDPYRGGRCCDLPIGRATEIGQAEPRTGLKRPEVEMTFSVRCHAEIPEES